jgi:hypothetical protein
LIDINGPTDGNAPKVPNIIGGIPTFTRAYRVYDWNWACSADGCRGALLTQWEVTLIAFRCNPGTPVKLPSRAPELYGGGFKALILYAEANRLTATYTREDTIANGYSVHYEDIAVDPNLLNLYNNLNAQGRANLPGIKDGDVVGTCMSGKDPKFAIRDRGQFMDPRARKDWY